MTRKTALSILESMSIADLRSIKSVHLTRSPMNLDNAENANYAEALGRLLVDFMGSRSITLYVPDDMNASETGIDRRCSVSIVYVDSAFGCLRGL